MYNEETIIELIKIQMNKIYSNLRKNRNGNIQNYSPMPEKFFNKYKKIFPSKVESFNVHCLN